jgi:hypothetical protein
MPRGRHVTLNGVIIEPVIEQTNPYRAPEAPPKAEEPQTISESRYLANFGCSAAVLLIAVPMTGLAGYHLLAGSFEAIGAFLIGLLFIVGTVRSYLWARRRRPKLPLKLW